MKVLLAQMKKMKTEQATADSKANGFQTPHDKKRHAKSVKKAKGTNKKSGKLGQVLGHSVLSVIRCFGKAGWDFDTAKAALKKAKIQAADHTIRVGLKRGRNGDKTRRIAPLSAKELDSLKAK